MKKTGLLFTITFGFFLLGQLLWTIGLLIEDPLFGSKSAEDWSINILFALESSKRLSISEHNRYDAL